MYSCVLCYQQGRVNSNSLSLTEGERECKRSYFRGCIPNSLRIILLTYNYSFCLIFQPCREVIIDYLKDHLLIIMGIAFGLAVIEVPVYTIKIFSS